MEKAELLRKQYTQVFSDPNAVNVEEGVSQIPEEDVTLTDITFDESDIVSAIKELDPYAAAPDDDIPARVLCSCKEQLAKPLMLMWSKSFHTGIIPPSLKNQFITPIYKKGNQTDPANYRPVSLTSHLIKIFERVLRIKIVQHLETSNIVTESQHGFRKNRLIEAALPNFLTTSTMCLNV